MCHIRSTADPETRGTEYFGAKIVAIDRVVLSRVFRCRANMAHIRQSRPDSGLDFQVKVLKPLKVFLLRSEAVGGERARERAKGREKASTSPVGPSSSEPITRESERKKERERETLTEDFGEVAIDGVALFLVYLPQLLRHYTISPRYSEPYDARANGRAEKSVEMVLF